MQAVTLTGYSDGVDVLHTVEIAAPRPGPADVLIEVHAAGVNPFDCKLRRGWLQRFYPLTFPCVLGNDLAGVVVEKGPQVWGLKVGDRVYGMQANLRSGAYAEYASVNAALVRLMPENLSFLEAASLPLAYQTAWMGLAGFAQCKPGQLVLVHGGAGGVGSAAVQLAKSMGARVAATCRADAFELVQSLGADITIDYTAQDFTQSLRNVDVTFDTIGGQVNLDSYRVMRPDGVILVVLREDPLEMQNRERLNRQYRVRTSVISFESLPDVLDFIRPDLEKGVLKPVIKHILPLREAREAHRLLDAGHARGKIVLTVRP